MPSPGRGIGAGAPAWECSDHARELGPSFHRLRRTSTDGLVIVSVGVSGGISGRYWGKSRGLGAGDTRATASSSGAGHPGSRTSCDVSSGGGATARRCAAAASLSPAELLAAQTPAGASQWPQPEPRPDPSSAASPALWALARGDRNPTPRLSKAQRARRGAGPGSPRLGPAPPWWPRSHLLGHGCFWCLSGSAQGRTSAGDEEQIPPRHPSAVGSPKSARGGHRTT